MKLLKSKDRKLGVAQGGGRYDLPLDKDEGSSFLILLVGLMTFLGVMALSASFVLSAMTERWDTGLKQSLTIEIPAEKSGDQKGLRSKDSLQELAIKVQEKLNTNKNIASSEILSSEHVKGLISPWLDTDIIGDELPLPALVSVTLKDGQKTKNNLEDLQQAMHIISQNIKVDTHESWLDDLLRFTGTLQFASGLIAFIIGATTIIAIASAIRAKMAVHEREVSLLHLMGSSDQYIARQFQKHAFILSLQGAAAGMLAGLLIAFIIGNIGGGDAADLIPNFSISASHIVALALIPVLACIIAAITARITVLRALAKMP